MAPREPTRAQLSSKLAYSQHTPSFLLKLQNRMNGIPDDEEEYQDDDEFEYTGEGRAPIPRRPAIPERPADEPGSEDEDEDFADEKPQVVVLKAGKHLTELEAENIRRKEKGLPPLPTEEEKAAEKSEKADKNKESTSTSSKANQQGLSFSSSSKPGTKTNKRKAVGQLDELKAELESKSKSTKSTSKKAKKQSKTLLSFGDDA